MSYGRLCGGWCVNACQKKDGWVCVCVVWHKSKHVPFWEKSYKQHGPAKMIVFKHLCWLELYNNIFNPQENAASTSIFADMMPLPTREIYTTSKDATLSKEVQQWMQKLQQQQHEHEQWMQKQQQQQQHEQWMQQHAQQNFLEGYEADRE